MMVHRRAQAPSQESLTSMASIQQENIQGAKDAKGKLQLSIKYTAGKAKRGSKKGGKTKLVISLGGAQDLMVRLCCSVPTRLYAVPFFFLFVHVCACVLTCAILFKCVCMCVCVAERTRERERKGERRLTASKFLLGPPFIYIGEL